MNQEARVRAVYEAVRRTTTARPSVGIVLGSGLGPIADRMQVESAIPTADLPGYPRSTVEGHEGLLVFGSLGHRPVVALKGRIHGYEGYSLEDVVLPIRLMASLGVRALVLTNAAGGINPGFAAGDIMLIDDHINLQGQSPLRGPNVAAWGKRFPDMSEVYSRRLRGIALSTAERRGLGLARGVYLSLPGPQYETPAEVRMLASWGADAVGMSTVPEAIAARHMGLEILGFSVITNLAAGISKTPLSHEEVMQAGKDVGGRLSDLVAAIIDDPSFLEPLGSAS